MVDTVRKTKSSIKQLIIPGMLFENMGLTYLGPVDGHNMRQMMKLLMRQREWRDRLLSMSLQKKAEAMDRHLPIRSVFTEQVLLTSRVADPLQQKQRRHIRIIFPVQYVLWQRRTKSSCYYSCYARWNRTEPIPEEIPGAFLMWVLRKNMQ